MQPRPASSQRLPASTPGLQPEAPTLKILAVDDDVWTLRLVELVVGEAHCVERAANLAEAREKLGREHYDLLLLDLVLPDGSGLDLLREVRLPPGLTINRDLPVVLLTGSQEAAVYEACFDLGAVAYMMKPFEVNDLQERVAEVASHKARWLGLDPVGLSG